GSSDIKLPTLSDRTITNMVDNFEVANEHMSAVRYLADYTFHFRPARVRRLMQEAGIAIGDSSPVADVAAGNSSAGIPNENATGGRPAVMLPVYKDGAAPVLWDDPNPWRDAWAERPARPGATRLIVPLGGAAELTVIDAPQAIAGEAEALGKIAAENGGGDAIVA